MGIESVQARLLEPQSAKPVRPRVTIPVLIAGFLSN